jgi:hypothetical protein
MAANTGEGMYPVETWDSLFQKWPVERPTARELLDFDFADPAKWDMEPPKEDVDKECEPLLKLIDDREPIESTIRGEARDHLVAMLPVLEAFKLNYGGDPPARALVLIVNHNLRYPVFHFKAEYKRSRPWHTKHSADLKAMFPPGDLLHPGHGSYPSSHAALAYFWAEFLGHFDGGKKADALKAAKDVAHRREIAGLHFASDTDLGRRLGINVANRMIAAKRLDEIEIDTLLQR